MKVVFWDNQAEAYFSVPCVAQLDRIHNGKRYEYQLHKENGYIESYKCSRFEINRIERESHDGDD